MKLFYSFTGLRESVSGLFYSGQGLQRECQNDSTFPPPCEILAFIPVNNVHMSHLFTALNNSLLAGLVLA